MLTKFDLARNSAQDRFKTMPLEQREELAFKTCGCLVAWPWWWMQEDGSIQQVDCVHLECQIRRGEYRRPAWLVRLTAEFRGELSNGWLRFNKETARGRSAAAALYWAMKRRQQFDIMACVWGGIAPSL